MSGLSLGMVVEGLVALLLLLTIGYCVTLNRRLQRLRADEEMLRATISELITATEIAERAILGLKATANDCEKNITARLAEAGHASSRLSDQVAAGENVFHKIAQITGAVREPSAVSEPKRPPLVQQEQNFAAPAVVPAGTVGERRPPIQTADVPREAVEADRGTPVRLTNTSVTSNLIDAAEAAAIRVQNLRRMTGDKAA